MSLELGFGLSLSAASGRGTRLSSDTNKKDQRIQRILASEVLTIDEMLARTADQHDEAVVPSLAPASNATAYLPDKRQKGRSA